MEIEIAFPAGPGQRFSEEAAGQMVGQLFGVLIPGGQAQARVLRAELADGGQAILLTLDAPEEIAELFSKPHPFQGLPPFDPREPEKPCRPWAWLN